MRVLFICSFDVPPPRTIAMARILSQEGHQVRILTWNRSPRFRESHSEVLATRFHFGSPYGQKAFFHVLVWLTYCFHWLLVHDYEVVQPQNLDNLIPSVLVKKIKRYRIVYDLADFYADGYLPQSSRLKGLAAAFERRFAKESDGMVLAYEGQRSQLRMHESYKNCLVIYNAPTEDALAQVKRPKPDSGPDALTFFYGGILSSDRFPLLLELARAIDQLEGLKFVVAGFGEMEALARAEFGKLRSVEFLGGIPHEEILSLSASSDVIVLPYDDEIANNRIALSNKLFEAMALAKPMLAHKGTLMARIVAKYNCGFVVDFRNPKELEIPLCKMVTEGRPFLRGLGENARKAFTSEYSWSSLGPRFIRLYDELQPAMDASMPSRKRQVVQ